MATRSVSRERYSFANLDEPLELPDLIAIQRSSFDWFLNEGLANTFRDISPIKDFSESLQLELEFDPFDEDLRPPPINPPPAPARAGRSAPRPAQAGKAAADKLVVWTPLLLDEFPDHELAGRAPQSLGTGIRFAGARSTWPRARGESPSGCC